MRLNKNMILMTLLIVIVILFLSACTGQGYKSKGISDLASVKDSKEADLASTSCVDSDSGINENFKGTVIFKETKVEDYCDGDKLIEYYCSKEGMLLSEIIPCQFGCSNGACIADEVGETQIEEGFATLLFGYTSVTLESNETYEYYDGEYYYIQLIGHGSNNGELFVTLLVNDETITISEHESEQSNDDLNIFVDEINVEINDLDSVTLLLDYLSLSLENHESATVSVDGDDYDLEVLGFDIGADDVESVILSVNGNINAIEEFVGRDFGDLSVYADLIAILTIY